MAKKITAICEETKHQQGNSIVVFAVGAESVTNPVGMPGAVGQRQGKTVVSIQSIEPDVIKALRQYEPGNKYEIVLP